MKKAILILLVLASTLLSDSLVHASKPITAIKTKMPEGGEGTNVTLDMLNCKVGFYKTYQDFVNQTPLNWKFQNVDYFWIVTKTLQKYNVVFLDETGKKVSVPASDFWGFKSPKGQLCRNMPFVSGKVTAISAYIVFVSKDFVFYYAFDPNKGTDFSPGSWGSKSLNDEPINFFEMKKAHPEMVATLFKTSNALMECDRIPYPKKFITTELYNEHEKSVCDCKEKIPDLIAWYKESIYNGVPGYLK